MTDKPRWARKRDRLQRHEANAARGRQPTSFSAMSPAEWRLLMITFVGGLASVVAGAAVLGLAVAAAKLARPAPGVPGGWLPLASVTVAAIFAFIGELKWAVRKTRFLVWWIGIFLFFLSLVWVGLALGIGAGNS